MKVNIKKRKRWELINRADLQELYQYRDLLYLLVKRDVNVLYKQTVLGFGWAILRPLVQMVIFTIIFGELAGIGKQVPDGVPYAVFSYVALVPWTYFSTSLTASTESLISNQQFITKVYFPRVIIPITPILAKLVDFLIAFSIMVLLMLYYGITPTINLLFLPVLLLLMILTSAGISFWLSAMAIQYRDIKQAIQFLAQILMYAAPVVWPISYVPERFLHIYSLYPIVGVIEGFRSALIGKTPMPYEMIGIGFVSATILFVSGAYYFRSKENIFADVA